MLEVGCGTGLILQRLARKARRAVGVDLSPGMLEVARKRGLDVHVADACDLPFDDETFDLACSFKVLAHVPDTSKALAEMARVTRPGGSVVAEFYNRDSLRTLVKRLKPASEISRTGEVTDTDVYTRYDTLEEIQGRLPAALELVRVDGIRILSPAAVLFNLPGVGRIWTEVERAVMKTPLRRFGGFLVVTLRRR